MSVSLNYRSLCFKCLSALGLFVVLVIFGCQQKPEEKESEPNTVISLVDPNEGPSVPDLGQEVAARVNGVDISKEKVDQLIQSEMKPYQASPEKFNEEFLNQREKELREQVVQKLVIEELMDEAVEKHGITVTDEEILQRVTELAESQTPKLTVEQFLKAIEAKGISIADYEVMLKRQMAWDKLVEPQIAGKYEVTEEEALEYFKDHPNNFGTHELVKASHIVFRPLDDSDPNMKAEAKARAEDVLKQIKEGADFAEMAIDYSEDATGINGGDLGYFKKGDMEPAFEKVAFSLPVGELSDVVETSYGYHIIKVADHKAAEAASFDMVKEPLIAELSRIKKSGLIAGFLRQLQEEADVKINK